MASCICMCTHSKSHSDGPMAYTIIDYQKYDLIIVGLGGGGNHPSPLIAGHIQVTYW